MPFLPTRHEMFFICAFVIFSMHSIRGHFVYINGASFKVLLGISVPIEIDSPGGSLGWFTNLQAIYHLPDNVSYFQPYEIVRKRSVKNTFNRLAIYKATEKYLGGLGITGNECVRRLICHVARKKINGQFRDDLLGEIIRIIFSPRNENGFGLEEYRKAEWQGMNNDTSCGMTYRDCKAEKNSIFWK